MAQHPNPNPNPNPNLNSNAYLNSNANPSPNPNPNQALWRKAAAKGEIYLHYYKGWYNARVRVTTLGHP